MRNRLFQENHARDCQEIEELRSICCEEADRARQARSQILELQNKVNSLSDAKESYDPESGSSSGATHVPDQTSTILSPRTLPRCDSGSPRDALNGTGIAGEVFERPPAWHLLLRN